MALKGKLIYSKEKVKEDIKFPVFAKYKGSSLIFLFTDEINGMAVVEGNYASPNVNKKYHVGDCVFSPDSSFCITDGHWEILPKGASITITQE